MLNVIFAILVNLFIEYFMTNDNKAALVLQSDGTIYHLKLKPGDVSDTILLVGDPGRAKTIADHFDSINFQQSNREINTYTGIYKGKAISVISTGMGTDNVEIVVNELDALFNIDFETLLPKENLQSLNLIRIGTSGGLQDDIPVEDSFLVSEYALGLDGLAWFYDKAIFVMEREMTASFANQMDWDPKLPKPYAVKASDKLLKHFEDWPMGITLTAPGFYAPQGRELRLAVMDNTIVDRARAFKYGGMRVTNFEMESSALYALSAMLGHHAITVCDIIANRVTKAFTPDYTSSMEKLIHEVLEISLEL